jgi:hypothetical protein
MSTHHANCIVCDEELYCSDDGNHFWLSCGNGNTPFEKPTALCSYECYLILRDALINAIGSYKGNG